MVKALLRPASLLLAALVLLVSLSLPVYGADGGYSLREDPLPMLKELASNGRGDIVFSGGGGALFVGTYSNGTVNAREYAFHPDGSGIRTLEYANGLYWLCTNSGALYSSADGLNWTGMAALPYAVNGIIRLGDAYYAPGQGGILYSTDGRSWTSSYASGVPLHDIAYGDGTVVAVGAQGTVVYSDAGTWKAIQPGGEDRPFYAVAYGNGVFVAGGGTGWGGTGMVYASGDGASWQRCHSYPNPDRTEPDENGDICFENCSYAISWVGDRFVATGLNRISSGFVMQSRNGVSWTKSASHWGKDVAEVAPGEPLIVTGGWDVGYVKVQDTAIQLEIRTASGVRRLTPSNPITPRFSVTEPKLSADYKY